MNAQTTLQTQKLLGGKVAVEMPAGFNQLSDAVVAQKYQGQNRPTQVYGNANATINLVVNHTQDPIRPTDLDDAFIGFTEYFTDIYKGMTWYTKEIQQINGKRFIVFEFQTPAVDTEIYNLMFMTDYQQRLLIFSFNCTKAEKAAWQNTALKIKDSVKFL